MNGLLCSHHHWGESFEEVWGDSVSLGAEVLWSVLFGILQ